MAQEWLFLKSAAPEMSATALTSNTLYRAMVYELYSLDKMLGVAYDMYSHELYQKAHNLIAELIRHFSLTDLSEAHNLLSNQLGSELFNTVAGFDDLLKRYEIY